VVAGIHKRSGTPHETTYKMGMRPAAPIVTSGYLSRLGDRSGCLRGRLHARLRQEVPLCLAESPRDSFIVPGDGSALCGL
jgi:hypothetical protein